MLCLSLPPELERFREKLEPTVKPVIRIQTKPQATAWHQSKFGGLPYLPKGTELPKDASGAAMRLLAQINFEELPLVLEDLPEKGILQFFLSPDADGMGLDFDDQTNQSNFRMVFYEEPVPADGLVTDFSFLEEPKEDDFPPYKESALSFIVDQDAVSNTDRTFEAIFKGIDYEEVVKVEGNQSIIFWQMYAEHFSGEGHKIGGYPFFAQVDLRENERYTDYDVLLLQVDTDEEAGITWGDTGVGNFFISKENLKKRKFSDVVYNWDCY